MKTKNLVILLLIALLFSGCGVFSPYNSKFQCESPDKGKCVSVQKAYAESLGKDEPQRKQQKKKAKSAKDGKEKESSETNDGQPTATDSYRESLQREMARLIDAPVTPLMLPPKVMRILVLPYPDKSVLYMPRYIYIMTDKPRWVIGDYLLKEGKK